MKSVIITGSSNGIGKAISEDFLKNGFFVYGLDRNTKTITHPNYKHFVVDIFKDELPSIPNCDILINNAGTQNENDIDIKEKSKNILTFLKENRKMLSELIRFRNKEICHFDENVLTHNAVAQNAQCLNIKVLKQFLTRIEELVSQLRLAYTKDGIYETMCPINSSDANSMKDILDTFIEFKSEIIELKYQKKTSFNSIL